MDETLALIEQLIKEHKVISDNIQSIEAAANDASLLADLEDAGETFVPGRFDQKQSLEKLEGLVQTIESWLEKHFNREETALLKAIEQHGDSKFVTAFNSLLLEHADLKNRVAQTRSHVAELAAGGMGAHQWAASASDMRAHLNHTRKLLEAHAGIENELFAELRQHLLGKKKGN
jgi:hemerythrin-like domain-containing protein